ncbi:MAG: cytochrome P450 [Actinomycetota bacterium]|nr:cytochrome P450 [Actinomycetota bacterium]
MTTYAEADLPQLFPGTVNTAEGARALFADARASATIGRGAFGPIAIHHHDVVELLRDKRLRGPGMDFARVSGIPEGSRAWKRQEQILLFMEGDDHHRLRRLVSKAFTPKAVEALRPTTRATIAGLLDAVIDAGSCDAVPALCEPFPIPIICALVGIEPDRVADMSRWASSILQSLRLDAGAYLAEIEQAQAELDDYLDVLIDERRAAPRDDLLSNLILAEEEGDRLSRSELQSVVAMMLVAGTDTTRNQLSNMIHTFAEHPDQWALLRSRPDLVPNAVEEAIRWEPATEALPRVAAEPLEIGGYHVEAGSIVVLMSMSANHDTAVMADADVFDIARETPAGWHLLTFGGGIHYCLGASLARLELTEALAELSSRLPGLRPAGEAVTNPPGSVIAGYTTLPIAWG